MSEKKKQPFNPKMYEATISLTERVEQLERHLQIQHRKMKVMEDAMTAMTMAAKNSNQVLRNVVNTAIRMQKKLDEVNELLAIYKEEING